MSDTTSRDIDISGPSTSFADERSRALVSVVTGLAEDLGVECAVVVLDRGGDVRHAERGATTPAIALDQAITAARARLAGRAPAAARSGVDAVILRDAAALHGALGVSGGPDGFASDACRAAARALGFGVPG